MAECELSALTRQSLKTKRIATIDELRSHIDCWVKDINGKQRGVDWQMQIKDARIKLKSVYPKIKV